jgi:hypothetical protein
MGRPTKFKSGAMKPVNVRLSTEAIANLNEIAGLERREFPDVLRIALDEYIDKYWKKNRKR